MHGLFPPGDILWRRSEWSDFKFAQNQVLRAIEPCYSLNDMIENWATISKSQELSNEQYFPILQTS